MRVNTTTQPPIRVYVTIQPPIIAYITDQLSIRIQIYSPEECLSLVIVSLMLDGSVLVVEVLEDAQLSGPDEYP